MKLYHALTALLIFGTAFTDISRAQPPMSIPEAGADQFSLDSLQRVISKRILNDGDKKEIRACEREKAQFLQQCRASDPGAAEVDRLINDAKVNSANPNDPAIQALMEKKFTLEKACDDRFSATSRGKQCQSGAQKRQLTLEKALAKDKEYQKLRKHLESLDSEHL